MRVFFFYFAVHPSSCTLTDMTITAYPYEPFTGHVYIVGYWTPVEPVPSACYLKGTPLSITYAFSDETCGDVWIDNWADVSTTSIYN